MKQYITLLCVLLAFASCEEITNSAEESKVTFLPRVEMEGESEIELDCDATGFTDPGVTMTEDGTELEVEVVTTGTFFGGSLDDQGEWHYDNVPIDGPDAYEISYSAENRDGIPGTAIRSVYWPVCQGDLNTSLAGMYSSDLVRTTAAGGAAGTYNDVGPIMIKDIGNNTYQISDMLGGWYVFGRALGYTYGAPGATVKVNNIATDDFTHDTEVTVQTFGDLARITEFTVDPPTKTIKYTVEWDAGFVFKVTLTQM